MKSTVELLSKKERQLLALFYETETHSALKRLCELERLELAKDAIDLRDIQELRYASGQAASLKKLFGTLKGIYKETQKS